MNAPDRMDAIRVPAGVPKIAMEPDQMVQNAATFKVAREDHTLGHLVRMELLRDPSIKFAGYKHPHPLDNDILIRVQTGSARQTPAQAFVQCMHRLEGELRDMEHSFYSELQRVKKASGEFA